MKLSFLSSILCVIFACGSGFLSAAKWLDKQAKDIPWSSLCVITSNGELCLKKKGGRSNCPGEELCDVGLCCVLRLIRTPERLDQNVPELTNISYRTLLSAVRVALHKKNLKKQEYLKNVTVLIERFSAVVCFEANHELIRQLESVSARSRQDSITALWEHLRPKKTVSADGVESWDHLVTADSYKPLTEHAAALAAAELSGASAPALPGVGVGGAPHVLPPGQRPRAIGGGAAVREPLAQQSQPVQFPGPCAGCQQRVLTDGQTYGEPITNPGEEVQNPAQKKKHVGPRVAGVVLAAALTGLLIDCAVRKKRSWLARFAAATGRGFRSFFRWLKIPGRPSQIPQE
jgi:hypothetical protein